MSKIDFLSKYFHGVDKVQRNNSNGTLYNVKLPGNQKAFVKLREKSSSNWFLWGLRKEYKVSQIISSYIDTVPKPLLMCESKEYIAVAFEKKKSTLSYYDLYEKPSVIEDSLADYVSALEALRSLRNSTDSCLHVIKSLSDREEFTEDGYISTREYILDKRMIYEPSLSNEFYEEYRELLIRAQKRARELYSEERETIIHGDLVNSSNLLFGQSGLNAIVDFEISGWFDYLYDVASIGAILIDKPCMFSSSIDKTQLRQQLYSDFSIADEEKEVIDCYKCWFHYFLLENLNYIDKISHDGVNIDLEFCRQKKILDRLKQNVS